MACVPVQQFFFLFYTSTVKPLKLVGSAQDFRTGGRWFDPRLGQYSFRGLMKVTATGFILLSPLSMAWKEYCAEYWLKECQESMDRCSGRREKNEVLLKLFTTQSQLLTTLKKESFENIVVKEENAGNQHFLLFPQCSLSYPEQILPFESRLLCRLQMLPIRTGLKFCRLVKG